LTDARLETLIGDARAARSRIREAAYQQLHREPYRADMGPDLLTRIPADLDALNEHVIVTVCSRLGFAVEHTRGRRTYAIELGNESLVDNLPGVPGGSSYVGSFDREEAVDDETIDFFASGHPLVEGVFALVEDSQIGRAVRLEIEIGDDQGYGLIAIYKDGPGFDVVAHDHSARTRPDWAAAFRQRPLRIRKITADVDDREWTDAISRLATRLDPSRRPHALAAVIVRPERQGRID